MVSTCGPFRFTSNFDSGNFSKVELVEPHRKTSPGHNFDYEVNVWTRPDCHGTKYENGNRTWFHFGIRGGKSHSNVKLNILNLNKQTKLFHQGMQPVFRILPDQPHWERVQDRLTVNETLDHICSISFRQRLPEDTKNSTLYIAFSYPFSYIELREWMTCLDVLFPQSLPPEFSLDRIKLPLPNDAEQKLVSAAILPIENEIYYRRECACYSLEGRVVDLITLTSMYGMSSEREDRLANLFPETSQERPHKFPAKKVVFLSARVHPGETPSTFVLNGFFKFVLERNDPRAILLRRLFVFKFMPMLNPDGVARGHYRTDPRGVNLNRVYLNPSPTLHPSIYAARKLLLYYHFGHDTPDDYDYPTEPAEDNQTLGSCNISDGAVSTSKCDDPINGSSNLKLDKTDSSSQVQVPSSSNSVNWGTCVSSKEEFEVNSLKQTSGTSKKYTFVLSDANSLCAGCTMTPYELNKKGKGSSRRKDFIDKKKRKKRKAGCGARKLAKQSRLRNLSSDCIATCSSSSELHTISQVVPRTASKPPDLESTTEQASMDTDALENAEMETENHHCAFEACDEDSVLYTSDILNANVMEEPNVLSRNRSRSPGCALSENKKETVPALAHELKKESVRRFPSDSIKPKLNRDSGRRDALDHIPSKSSFKSTGRLNSSTSGLFLYVDMHGHATKRGIFMYGNHFPDAITQAETMLLPRLMSMNFQHFDFAACNFTERLMNMKDRRDGASREGSGRVACLKLTGLIRSYTLECNYNTGRLVNPLVPRPSSYGFVDPPPLSSIHHCVKFTPDIFEGTGKALAESVLDLTGQNPWSRISYTEFKSLEGMRRWMLNRLYHSPEYHSQSRTTSLLSNASKEKLTRRNSSSVSGLGIDSSSPPSGSTTLTAKSARKRSPKKRPSNKVLAELHPHGAATAGSSNILSDMKVTMGNPSAAPRNSSAPTRRSSLSNKLNCYVVPSSSRGKESNRRDPVGR